MDHKRRVDNFNGSDVAYIRYLEIQLEQTRRHVSQLCQSLPRRQNPASPHLATLATQTKGDVRVSLPGLHVRNWALD